MLQNCRKDCQKDLCQSRLKDVHVRQVPFAKTSMPALSRDSVPKGRVQQNAPMGTFKNCMYWPASCQVVGFAFLPSFNLKLISEFTPMKRMIEADLAEEGYKGCHEAMIGLLRFVSSSQAHSALLLPVILQTTGTLKVHRSKCKDFRLIHRICTVPVLSVLAAILLLI